jgi:hypothetical protein
MLTQFNYPGEVLEDQTVIIWRQNFQKITAVMLRQYSNVLAFRTVTEGGKKMETTRNTSWKWFHQTKTIHIFSQAKHHSLCHKFIQHFATEGFVRNIPEKMCLWRSKSAKKRMSFSCVRSITEQLNLNLPRKMTSRIKWSYKRPSNYFGLWVEGSS